MLPTPYHWLDNPDTCYLCFNYGTVAVLELKEGKVAGRVHWQGRSFWFKAGSFRQGKMWVERWIAARGNDLPSRPVKPRRRSREKAVLQALISKRPAAEVRVQSQARRCSRTTIQTANYSSIYSGGDCRAWLGTS